MTRLLRLPRLPRYLQIALVLLLTLATFFVARTLREGSTAQASGDVYAYLTDTEFGLVRGASVVARHTGHYNDDLHWTADGRYAFAVSSPSGKPAVIDVLGAGAATVAPVVCGCDRAAAAGGDEIAWVADGHLKRLRLGHDTGPHDDPWEIPSPGRAALAAMDGGTAYVVYPGAGTDAQVPGLSAVDRDGTGRQLESNTGGLALVRLAKPGGPLAYVVSFRGSGCGEYATVHVADRTGKVVEVPRSTEADAGNSESVRDLWWGRDGRLYATMSAWRCLPDQGGTGSPPPPVQREAQREEVVPPSLWRLDGMTWTKVDAGPLLAVRRLTGHTRVVVALSGELSTETDGHRDSVARGVRAVEVPSDGMTADPVLPSRSAGAPPLLVSQTGIGPVQAGGDVSRLVGSGALVPGRGGPGCRIWTGGPGLEGVTAYPDPAKPDRPAQVWVSGNQDAGTAEGIRIRSKLAELRKAYGQRLRIYAVPNTDADFGYFVDLDGNSIVFLTGELGDVTAIGTGPTPLLEADIRNGKIGCQGD